MGPEQSIEVLRRKLLEAKQALAELSKAIHALCVEPVVDLATFRQLQAQEQIESARIQTFEKILNNMPKT